MRVRKVAFMTRFQETIWVTSQVVAIYTSVNECNKIERMRRFTLVALILVFAAIISSCSTYTCPTYAKAPQKIEKDKNQEQAI